MPRSNWKGFISFGLVNIPITLFNSEETSDKVNFHQIDKTNMARIKYKRVNEKTGKEVPWKNIIKGYVYNKDTTIPVEDEELKHVVGENAKSIAIDKFVKADSIDLIDVEKTYYLVPDKKGEKGYVILREALKKSGTIGIAKVIISTKEYLGAVARFDNALVLYLLHYPDEIRPLSDFDFPSESLAKYKVNEKEVRTAMTLIKALTEKWKPKEYKDEFKSFVHKWAENKLKHKAPVIMRQRAQTSEVDNKDFISLLRKSLKSTSKKPMAKSVAISKKKKSEKRAMLH